MRIVWSPLAEETYYDNLSYLYENWPFSVISNFITEVEETMFLLKHNPEIFNWWDTDKKYKIEFIISISLLFTVIPRKF